MKKLTLALLSCVIAAALCACGDKTVPETTAQSTVSSETTAETAPAQQTTPAVVTMTITDAYEAVLDGSLTFRSVKTGEVLNISRINEILPEKGTSATVEQFSISDLDGDGVDEMILWVTQVRQELTLSNIPVVLRLQDGTLYAQAFSHAAFQALKKDGTFAFYDPESGSGGYASMQYRDGQWETEVIAEFSTEQSNSGAQTSYFINDQPVSQEAYYQESRQQDAKSKSVQFYSWDAYQRSTETTSVSSEAAAYHASLDRNSAAIRAYDAVLNANNKFCNADTNETLSLSRLLQNLSTGDTVTVKQLTVVDLGQDGTPEVVLWLASGANQQYGFEVLQFYDGGVFGYYLTQSSLAQLKIDGSFRYTGSSGAAGYGTMRFTDRRWEILSAATTDQQHQAKTDVIWFPDWNRFLYPNASPEGVSIEGVLIGRDAITDTATHQQLDISQIGKLVIQEEIPTFVRRLAAVDLDQDGTEEVVLQIAAEGNDNVGCVILRQENGQVHGQGYHHRPFHDLKTDGTYRSSSSSSDHSYGRKTFLDGQWVDIILAECHMTIQNSGSNYMIYYVDGQYSTPEEFTAFEAKQAAKQDVVWYDSWESYQASK